MMDDKVEMIRREAVWPIQGTSPASTKKLWGKSHNLNHNSQCAGQDINQSIKNSGQMDYNFS
jgi:hypothetical protein